MTSLKTKYIILIWIIILILFLFYCVFRLGYLREKYGNTLLQITETQPNIISYINNVENKGSIADISGCEDVYDDNIAVKLFPVLPPLTSTTVVNPGTTVANPIINYNNCQTAYADYLSKNKDVKSIPFGESRSLSDICPITAKSPKYSQCLQSLMNNFSDNANILDNINTDMTTSINKRIAYRADAVSNIQTAINPFIHSKAQSDFNKNMQMNGQVPQYQEDVLGLVNNYYQSKYKTDKEGFINVSSISGAFGTSGDPTPTNLSTMIITSSIKKKFFGTYQPVKGQFPILNYVNITLNYDNDNQSYNPLITVGNIVEEIPRTIILTIDNGTVKIIYNVVYIENYNALDNVIKINLTEKTTFEANNSQNQSPIMQQLLSTLGINAPARLIMTYEEYTSQEKKLHKTYKLVNDNLDTILILNKIK